MQQSLGAVLSPVVLTQAGRLIITELPDPTQVVTLKRPGSGGGSNL